MIRLVKMDFRLEKVKEFLELFEERKNTIISMPGCLHLELWQDQHAPGVFYTYSLWNKEEDLNHYRNTVFFKNTWATTKSLFRVRAEAWSLNLIPPQP